MHIRTPLLLIIISLFVLFVSAATTKTITTGSRSLLNGKFLLSWTLDEESQTIEHTVTVKGVRTWIGLGWTHNRAALMANASMVAIVFDQKTKEPKIECYIGAPLNTMPIKTPTCYATLSKVTVDEKAKETTVVFKRNLAVDGGTEAFNVPIIDEPMYVIVAYGYAGQFAYHIDRRDSVAASRE